MIFSYGCFDFCCCIFNALSNDVIGFWYWTFWFFADRGLIKSSSRENEDLDFLDAGGKLHQAIQWIHFKRKCSSYPIPVCLYTLTVYIESGVYLLNVLTTHIVLQYHNNNNTLLKHKITFFFLVEKKMSCVFLCPHKIWNALPVYTNCAQGYETLLYGSELGFL